MSDAITRKMIRLYRQMASPMMFFTGLFRSDPMNFFSTEEVEFDILRTDEEIAIAVTSLSSDYRDNEVSQYTNKSFKPPIFKERILLNAYDMLKRMPGRTPFEDPAFRSDLGVMMLRNMVEIQNKVMRTVELQASQAMQTGTVTLGDAEGNPLYTVDFQPKATHFPTSSTTWGQAGDDKLGDIEALVDQVRDDGLMDPEDIIFGEDAWREWLQDEAVAKLFNKEGLNLASVMRPDVRGMGGKYHGTITIGNYSFNMWSYNGRYIDPQTRVKTKYLDPGKVWVGNMNSRFDAVFGAVPNFNELFNIGSGRLLPELPSRFSLTDQGADMFTNVWTSGDGQQLFGGIASRPLMVPTAIDQYGCLDTGL